MPEFKELMEILISIGVILLLIVGKYLILPKLKEIFFKKDPVIDSIVLDQKVIYRLEMILKKTKADRVRIFRFHNGGKYYPNGKSMQKMSCQYEVLADGIAGNIQELQNLLLSPFSLFLTRVLNGGRHSIHITETIDDEQIRNFNRSMAIKEDMTFPLYSIDNKFMGFLSINYVKSEFKLEQEEIEEIEDNALLLSGYLEE